jgi:predicted ArsR family transcriptional regulator
MEFRQSSYPIEGLFSGPAAGKPAEETPLNADLDARLDRVAALGEPARRALYRFVAAQAEPVSREQAAAGVGVPHHVAKFHLDRLVDDGLLQAEYRRPVGRSGPGAGRPAKLYRRIDVDLEVSLPPRRYDLVGRLLVRAVALAERTDAPIAETLRDVAHDAGRQAGALDAAAVRTGRQRVIDPAVVEALDAHGFEPRVGRDGVTLSNCPFHSLATEETELVCGMNLAFLEGLLAGIGASSLHASLEPTPGRCCVRIRPS